ncbi:MAG: indole-3-glycerol phosphate synthase TrpC [Candidatus Obscuribacterales bacterium]|nr:indole-3-glycerol phosphate synthase TrpC [Candidatus Obscuribacterales bacterium]
MSNFLADVIQHKKSELESKKAARSLDLLKSAARPASSSFLRALEGDGLKIIAEIKPRSPSLGQLDSKVSLEERLEIYQSNAQAVSVLCDQRFFGGSIELLQSISAKLSLPTLLKDFVIDPYQVYEARVAGAEAVLLIAKILQKHELEELNSLVLELGMTPLIEVQTEDEIDFVESINPALLLINNRNLETLKMDLQTVERLVKKLKYNSKVIAASGIENAEQMMQMRPFASRFLIGSALMACDDPLAKFREFSEAEASFQKQMQRSKSCQS